LYVLLRRSCPKPREQIARLLQQSLRLTIQRVDHQPDLRRRVDDMFKLMEKLRVGRKLSFPLDDLVADLNGRSDLPTELRDEVAEFLDPPLTVGRPDCRSNLRPPYIQRDEWARDRGYERRSGADHADDERINHPTFRFKPSETASVRDRERTSFASDEPDAK
jgi:hypothetical protein